MSEVGPLEGPQPLAFVPGSIHRPEYRDFWVQELQVSMAMANILESGYQIPFRQLPTAFEAANNKTVRDNLGICRTIVLEMVELGVASFVKTKPL